MVVSVRRAVLALSMLVAVAPARAEEPSVQQKVALVSKPAVVRVMGAYIGKFEIEGHIQPVAIGGSGTGFFITADGYIATNAHVVEAVQAAGGDSERALRGELAKELQQRFPQDVARMSRDEFFRMVSSFRLIEVRKLAYVVLPNGDKLDYEIKQYGAPGTGRDCAIIKVQTSNAPSLAIGDSKQSQVEDRIVVIGYPGVADQQDLLDEKSQLEPSITDGSISALKKANTGEQILQISASITHGNSGGPAIDQHGNVVGLATFGTDVQGFNFLVASSTLQQFITAAKIEPKESDTTKAWRDGLDHYWADEYSAAITKFEEVETGFPQHAEAVRFVQLSHQAQKDGKEKKPSAGSGAVIGAAVGGGVLLLIVIIVIVASRKKKPAAAQSGQMMYGRAPVGGPGIAKTVAINSPGAPMAIGALWCTRGRLMGQRFPLAPTGIIVGRQPGVAHVLIDDQRASGKHVWIGVENGRLVAIDQGTTNGTYVNDIMRGRITRAELRDGDVVIVGDPDCLSLQIRLGQG